MARRGVSARGVQRGAWRQAGGTSGSWSTPDRGGVVRSTPIARYIYENGTHGKRCRRWAEPRTTWWCCPTPTWNWPPTLRCRPGSGRRVSGAWPSRWWSRWRRRRSAVAEGDGTGRKPAPAPALTLTPKWAPCHPEHRDRVVGYIQKASKKAPSWSSTAGYAPKAKETASTSAHPVRPGHPDMTIYKDDLRSGPVHRPSRHLPTSHDLNNVPYGNGTAVFTNDGGAARLFQTELSWRSASTCPYPSPPTSFGDGKTPVRHPPDRWTHGVDFYTRQSRQPLARPCTGESTSDSPARIMNRTAGRGIVPHGHEREGGGHDFGGVIQTDPPASKVIELTELAEANGFTYG